MSRPVREGVLSPRGYHALIVIPIRNRAELAINTIRSVLNQTDCEFSLLVSDNRPLHRSDSGIENLINQLTTASVSLSH